MFKIENPAIKWIINAAIGVAIFAAGFVTNYYVDFRANYVAALGENYERFNDASSDIQNTLRLFSDIASGTRPKSDSDVRVLEDRLLAAVGRVEDLERRVKRTSPLVTEYRDSVLRLRDAAQEVDGPENAKSLVLAVSDYLMAEQAVRDAVLHEYNSFLW